MFGNLRVEGGKYEWGVCGWGFEEEGRGMKLFWGLMIGFFV